jgi:phosphoribosylglycinamide formyltransferase-1
MAGRIVVLISGSGTNMDALVEACQRGDVPARVVAVVADRDCEGLRLAEKRDVPTLVVEPGGFETRDKWNEALRDEVAERDPDLVVSAGFMRLLAPVFVDAFEGRLINLHPSLLPSFPGAHGVRDALAAGVRVTGSTVHFIDNDVDHGPIILQRAVQIEPGETEDVLHERIKEVEHEMLPEACRLILEGKVALENGVVVFR